MASTQTAGTVAGYFETESKAETAIDALEAAGFKSSQIGLAASGTALPTSETDGDYGTASSAGTTTGSHTGSIGGSLADAGSAMRSKISGAADTAAHEGGGFWGKIKNFFDGEGAEPYAGEQNEGELGTREITTAGGSTSAYGSDDLHGSLSDLSLPNEHASYFRDKLSGNNQGYLVTVSAAERIAEAREILERNGADIGTDAASFVDTTASAGGTSAMAADTLTGAQNLKLYGEVLRVHKDRVSRGEVRVRKEITTETRTIEVPVTREELVIERVPVSGQAAVAGDEAFANQEIRIPLSEEQASVEKQAVVREEVRLGKREVSETEHFDETVRNENLKVDDETKVGR